MKVHTSLNMPFRKRENQRIERENHEIAKRLFDKQSVINKKSMDQEWQQYKYYQRRVQKMPDFRNSHGGSKLGTIASTNNLLKAGDSLQENSVGLPNLGEVHEEAKIEINGSDE